MPDFAAAGIFESCERLRTLDSSVCRLHGSEELLSDFGKDGAHPRFPARDRNLRTGGRSLFESRHSLLKGAPLLGDEALDHRVESAGVGCFMIQHLLSHTSGLPSY